MKYKFRRTLPQLLVLLLALLVLDPVRSVVIDKVGNGSVVAHYNYEQEYRDFVQSWADCINGIVSPVSLSKPRSVRSVCRLSEFSCGSSCIAGDRYCNGVSDCQDGSDERPGCSPCNRTYYGDYGSTYSISLTSNGHNAETAIRTNTFVCQLTFAAAGGEFGDLVQIMFESINIGRLSSPMVDGCPEGSLQVAEISRPATGGAWCGSGTGNAAYYSEMSAVALTLSIGARNASASIFGANSTLVHTNVNSDKTVFSSTEQGLNYEFKIRFKFLPKGGAVVRYGPPNLMLERGELVPGTYCSRVLDSCHQKNCKIQSPNYPGLYPRNTTCYFTIRQREVPTCKRVLIKVGQAKPHKVQLRSIGGKVSEGAGSEVISWDDCDLRDTLIFYDGTSTDDRVLLKICGGNTLPSVVGSGPDLLVAFHSTPYGNPLDPHPLPPFPFQLRGFELDVEVLVIDSFSSEVVNGRGDCIFVYTSSTANHPGGGATPQEFGGNWISGKAGVVSSPRHTLPPGTKCKYEFKGTDYENVWIYFTVYRRSTKIHSAQLPVPIQGPQSSNSANSSCTTRLRVLDAVGKGTNVLIGSYCDGEVPRMCDHKALQNDTRSLRACSMSESYVSAGSGLVLEQSFGPGTALHPLHYKLNYEFIRRHTTDPPSCNRHYKSRHLRESGTFRTSDNVFDFGRGGKANITCKYILELAPYEGITLQLINASFGTTGNCRTNTDLETGRYACDYSDASNISQIQISELIWDASNLTSHGHCVCGNTSGQIFTFLGRKVEILFEVTNMKDVDSYETHFAEFSYRIKKDTGCRGDNHLMTAESGLISLESSYGQKPLSCATYPYLIQSVGKNSLYLRIPGFSMMQRNESERMCPTTRNRIFIYNHANELVQKVCPASFHQLGRTTAHAEVYSEDFREYNSPLYASNLPLFKIEFIGRELGNYRIHWLQLVSARMVAALGAVERDNVRMGEAARAAGGGVNGTGVEKGAGPWEDPLWSSMFEEDLTGPQSQNDNRPEQICSHYCPELQACISPELWCDGEVHCPVTLADERSCDSFWLTLGQILSPAVYLPVAAGILSALFCCLLVLCCICARRLIRRGKKNGREAGRRRVPPRDLFLEPYDEGS